MSSALNLRQLRFVGQLLAMCLRTGDTLPVDFPPLVWKSLLGEQLERSDYEDVDRLCFKSIQTLRNIEQEGITPETFCDVIFLNFTTSSADGREVELVPGGATRNVTWESRQEYTNLVEEYRMRELAEQLHALGEGFQQAAGKLSVFDWTDVRLLVGGRKDISVEYLMRHTYYSSCNESSQLVTWLWSCVEKFSNEDRVAFVRFVSGRTTLPATSADFVASGKFQVAHSSGVQPIDTALPEAHTCAFQLVLFDYSSEEVLHAKLLYAIRHCQDLAML